MHVEQTPVELDLTFSMYEKLTQLWKQIHVKCECRWEMADKKW